MYTYATYIGFPHTRCCTVLALVLILSCSTSQMQAQKTTGFEAMHVSIGAHYNYFQHAHSHQVAGEATILRSRRELAPFELEFSGLCMSVGHVIDSHDNAASTRWSMKLASLQLTGGVWENTKQKDYRPQIPMDNTPSRQLYDRALGVSIAGSLLDINGTGNAELFARYLHTKLGAFGRFRTGADIDIGAFPFFGLTSYKLGTFSYGDLGSFVSTHYLGFEAGIEGMVRTTYRGLSLTLLATSTNVFAGRAVYFLTLGAKATVVLPRIGFTDSWVLSAEYTREHARFSGETTALSTTRIGVDIPFFLEKTQYDVWK